MVHVHPYSTASSSLQSLHPSRTSTVPLLTKLPLVFTFVYLPCSTRGDTQPLEHAKQAICHQAQHSELCFFFFFELVQIKKYWGAHSPQKALHSSTITELSRGKNDLAPMRTACPNQECRNKSLIGFIHPWQSNRLVETGVS